MGAFFGPGGNSDAFKSAGYKSTVEAPLWLSVTGLDAYEYEAGNGLSAKIETLAKIGQKARLFNIKMSYHTPYFISLSGVVEEKRLKSIDYIRQSLDSARLLGASTIVVHSGSCSKITRGEAMNLAKDTLSKTLDRVDNYGINIGLETMGKINQLGTLDEVLELCKLDSKLVPVVDFGHLNARECGGVFKTCADYQRVFDKIANSINSYTAEHLHCHFSKIEWTDSGEKRHLTFADKTYGPEFEPFIECIVKENLSPTVICESAGTQSDDALTMKNYYKKLLLE